LLAHQILLLNHEKELKSLTDSQPAERHSSTLALTVGLKCAVAVFLTFTVCSTELVVVVVVVDHPFGSVTHNLTDTKEGSVKFGVTQVAF
jgi:hypothetical protein